MRRLRIRTHDTLTPSTTPTAVEPGPTRSVQRSGVQLHDIGRPRRSGQIVRFDIANNSLIWAADSRSFSGYPVSGLFIRADRFFQVRFGTEDGERRAYFTEAVATTICDVEIVGGQLVINPTS